MKEGGTYGGGQGVTRITPLHPDELHGKGHNVTVGRKYRPAGRERGGKGEEGDGTILKVQLPDQPEHHLPPQGDLELTGMGHNIVSTAVREKSSPAVLS